MSQPLPVPPASWPDNDPPASWPDDDPATPAAFRFSAPPRPPADMPATTIPPRPRPHDSGPRPHLRPDGSGPQLRPDGSGPRPRLRPDDSGPRLRPEDSGPRPRPDDTGPRPRPDGSGPRPRQHDSGPRPRLHDSGPRPRLHGSGPQPRQHDTGPRPRQVVPDWDRDRRPPRESRRERPDLKAASSEWAKLVRSFVPEPVKRRWSREFLAGLEFRGWGIRVAIPILAMVVFGVAVVVIAGANSGNVGPTPPADALGYPPATLAGQDFTATASARGMTQTLGRITNVGNEVVAVGSQTGARIPRAQFFVSADGGHSWTLGTVKSASGGVPSPGHGAIFVAGGPGAWVALGPGSIWTSPDGRTWTLAPGNGMPLAAGDQINAVQRTAVGFIAVGANVPGGDQAKSTPVVFLSPNGTSWTRLDAARLHLSGALDVKYAAASGKLIEIAGDALITEPKKKAPVEVGAAWLSSDGGVTWQPTTAAAAPGVQPQVTGLAAVNGGFVLLRPATIAKHPAVDTFFSPNGLAFTFQSTLSAPAGFTAQIANGGADGAAVTGQTGTGQTGTGAGGALTAFVTQDGKTWRKAQPFGAAGSEAVSGVTLAPDGTVVTAGISAGPDSRQPALVLTQAGGNPERVDLAKIPGAVVPQLAVNAVAAQGSTQVAVGSANGFPAVWTSADGGSSWNRAAGSSPAVLSRPGTQQLTSVAHGTAGWLAVGGVTASAAEHPVVVTSAAAASWQAADSEPAFAGTGLFTQAAAASSRGMVIVGYQKIKQAPNGQPASARTIAAAWWSPGLTGWQRAADATPGALEGNADGTAAAPNGNAAGTAGGPNGNAAGTAGGPGGNAAGTAGAPGGISGRQMLAVTADPAGFVAVGANGRQPSAWTSADGRTWRQADVPLPGGAASATLQHVASTGRTVAAVGTAVTTAGSAVPFAARSADGGVTWTAWPLPAPGGLTSVTALTAAGRTFTATGSYGSTPGHQDVVVWTSTNGSAWRAAEPHGQGLTGPGIQAITSLAASGNTLTGVGYTASPNAEQPVFWQAPIR